MKFQLANRLLETNRATHTRTQREKEEKKTWRELWVDLV